MLANSLLIKNLGKIVQLTQLPTARSNFADWAISTLNNKQVSEMHGYSGLIECHKSQLVCQYARVHECIGHRLSSKVLRNWFGIEQEFEIPVGHRLTDDPDLW